MYVNYSNNNLFSNTININKNKDNYINSIEKNIDDKYCYNNLENMEFSIKTNNFNPKKNSDPNDWECRLIKRVSSFTSINDIN